MVDSDGSDHGAETPPAGAPRRGALGAAGRSPLGEGGSGAGGLLPHEVGRPPDAPALPDGGDRARARRHGHRRPVGARGDRRSRCGRLGHGPLPSATASRSRPRCCRRTSTFPTSTPSTTSSTGTAATRLPAPGRPSRRSVPSSSRGVRYAYEADRVVLHDVSLRVEPGQTVGIVGPSGAGKSTLVQLLLRLRSPDSGRYLVNGADASSYRLGDWASRCTLVPQDNRLLRGTVSDNIRFFRHAISDAAVQRAAEEANLHADIMRMPHGYDTLLGRDAGGLSGGQLQRLGLSAVSPASLRRARARRRPACWRRWRRTAGGALRRAALRAR